MSNMTPHLCLDEDSLCKGLPSTEEVGFSHFSAVSEQAKRMDTNLP